MNHQVVSNLPLFFFLMNRRPPRSTLFPTRRSSDLSPRGSRAHRQRGAAARAREPPGAPRAQGRRRAPRSSRSEEHTSELQSHVNLVCRLLPEEKKERNEVA